MLFAVLLAVFTHVFHFASKVAHYPVFLLFNIVLFGFFQEATMMAVGSIVGHEAIVRKTQFPRLVIPLAVVLHVAVQPGAEPDRGVRVHPRLRGLADVDVVAAAGGAGAAAGVHASRCR